MKGIAGLSKKDLIALSRTLDVIQAGSSEKMPKTDDELHAWILHRCEINIPRTSVCQGHVAPFDFFADIFFERVNSAIVMANRGGSKTMLAALWHYLNSKFKPKCEGASVGAIESQALRAYENLKKLIKTEGHVDIPDQHPDIASSIMRETRWKNGSRVEVLSGTMAAVNGPHPQKVHFDEVELADPDVFQESRHMSQSRHGIAAQDIITSTRKRAHGPMQKLIDDVMEAERLGMDPPYRLYSWCVFECCENQPGCQIANPNADNPKAKSCDCDRVVKGKWDDGSPRTFKDVCKGRLAKSQGWIPIEDVHKVFRTASQDVWEAQQECIKPSTAGLVLPMFARDRHCIKWWEPDPAHGPIYMGVDFGGSNPHAVLWFQVLRYDMDVLGYHQKSGDEPLKRLKEGTRVFFDEIYIAEVGNVELANMVVRREEFWRQQYPGWRVTHRFVDVQAKAARLDWANHQPNLITQSFAPKDVKAQVGYVKELVQDDMLVIDADRCEMMIQEYEAWHYPHKRGQGVDNPEVPVDDFDHACSASRYGIANVRMIEYQLKKGGASLPGMSDKRYADTARVASGPARYLPVEKMPR